MLVNDVAVADQRSRRLISFSIYSSAALAYLHFMLPDVEIEEEEVPDHEPQKDEAGPEDEGDGYEEFEGDEGSIFIPLGFARQKDRSCYRGSDPEWQSFISLANEPQRIERIQQELVDLIMAQVNGNVRFAHSLGGNPQAGRRLLDVQFPNGPPPEFERTGSVL
jgi:hypothetical protein